MPAATDSGKIPSITEIWEKSLPLETKVGKLSNEEILKFIQDLCIYFDQESVKLQLLYGNLLPAATFAFDHNSKVGLRNIINFLEKKVNTSTEGWTEYCLSTLAFNRQRPECLNLLKGMDEILQRLVYLSGNEKSASDVLVYYFLYDVVRELTFREKEIFRNVCRWFDNIQQERKLRGDRELVIFSKTKLY